MNCAAVRRGDPEVNVLLMPDQSRLTKQALSSIELGHAVCITAVFRCFDESAVSANCMISLDRDRVPSKPSRLGFQDAPRLRCVLILARGL